MKHYLLLKVMLVITVVWSGFAWAGAASPGLDNKGKIEALIHHVQTLKDATFVRNGTAYDSESAAKFLKAKWQNEKAVVTPRDFIEKVATKSSTTGKPYLIRFKDGKEVSCAAHLKAQLLTLESP